jgi:hypothetical protein
MHTVMIIGLGVCSLGLCLLVGHLLGPISAGSDSELGRAALVFVPLWLIGAALDMWIGVLRAGCSVADEAPVSSSCSASSAALALWIRCALGN